MMIIVQVFLCQSTIKSNNSGANKVTQKSIFVPNTTKTNEEFKRALDLEYNRHNFISPDVKKLFSLEFKNDPRDI